MNVTWNNAAEQSSSSPPGGSLTLGPGRSEGSRARSREHRESVHHLRSLECRAPQKILHPLSPTFRGFDANQGIQGRIDPYLFPLVVESQGRHASVAEFEVNLDRPEQQRGDARFGRCLGVLREQERETEVQAIDAGVAAV